MQSTEILSHVIFGAQNPYPRGICPYRYTHPSENGIYADVKRRSLACFQTASSLALASEDLVLVPCAGIMSGIVTSRGPLAPLCITSGNESLQKKDLDSAKK